MTPEALHTYIDQKLMAGHISEFYGPGDSLGVISTFPAACSLLLWRLGVDGNSRTAKKKILGLLIGGIGCLAAGYVWSLAFPSPHIWTSLICPLGRRVCSC
jgi:predicted acyltransferase